MEIQKNYKKQILTGSPGLGLEGPPPQKYKVLLIKNLCFDKNTNKVLIKNGFGMKIFPITNSYSDFLCVFVENNIFFLIKLDIFEGDWFSRPNPEDPVRIEVFIFFKNLQCCFTIFGIIENLDFINYNQLFLNETKLFQ